MRSLRFSSWVTVASRMPRLSASWGLGQIPCLAQLLERLILGMKPVGLGFDPRAPLGRELRHLVLQGGAHRFSLSECQMAIEALVHPGDEQSVKPAERTSCRSAGAPARGSVDTELG
jgi:hypothetical protein